MADRRSQSSLAQVKSKIKVVFLGDQSTGKTSILLRFMHDKFEEGLGATVGIDFMAKNFTVGSTNLRLQLWDTAGQQRFRSLIPSYLKDATVTFIVFDLTNLRSFENIREWIQLCQQNRRQKSITILLGNKSDLQQVREVDHTIIEEKAVAQGIKYFEISAKSNKNIQQAFRYAAEQYVNQTSANEMTIGNIQNLHINYTNKLGQNIQNSNSNKNIEIVSQRTQNKQKGGCC